MTILVRSDQPVTLVGGGPVDGAQLSRATALAPTVIGADSGANRAHELGVTVDHIIGDMDSVDIEVLGRIPEHLIAEQMSTDLDKCLYATEAPYYLGVGFTGGLIDHHLAACHSLITTDKKLILLGAEDICFRAPLDFQLDLPLGTRVSLFPMGEVTGRSTGLRWPIEGLEFSPVRKIGTSNETVAETINLGFDCPQMLIILPARYLETVVKYLFSNT